MGNDVRKQQTTTKTKGSRTVTSSPRTRGDKPALGRAVPRPTGNVPGETITQPNMLDDQLKGIQTDFFNRYNAAAERQMADYDRMMGGYSDWRNKQIQPLIDQLRAREPHQFSFERINPERGADTQFAMEGYRNFANTGGYSPQDIQEMRARGISPIRAAYGNSMMEIDRSAALGGGAGYAPNRIAALSKMQRELPGQLADATTNVNAQLAEAIRSGKLAGLAGVTGISEAEAGRLMQAALANQGADIQTQGMTEDAYNQWVNQQFAGQGLFGQSLDAERSLYGTTPGLATSFGNQALAAMSLQAQIEAQRANQALQQQNVDINQQQVDQQKTPWWKTALGYAGTIAPIAAGIWDRYRGRGGTPTPTTPSPTNPGGTTPTNPTPGVSWPNFFGNAQPRVGPGYVGVNFGNIEGRPPTSIGNRGGTPGGGSGFASPFGNLPPNATDEQIAAENARLRQVWGQGSVVYVRAQNGQVYAVGSTINSSNGFGMPSGPGKYRVEADGRLVKVG